MKLQRKHILTAAVAGVALSLAGGAQADGLAFGEDDTTIDFDVTTGTLGGANYFNRNTTTGGVAPGAGDVLFLGNDSTITHSAGESLSVISIRVGTAPAVGTAIETESGVSSYPLGATLNMTGGDVTTTGTGNLSTIVGDGTTATLNLSGGVWTVSGGAQVGAGGGASEVGSAGTLNVSGDAIFSVVNTTPGDNILVGNSPETRGVINLSDNGVVETNAFRLGNGGADNNEVNVSGGTLSSSGTGLFFVGASPDSTGNVINQTGGAVIAGGVDGAGNSFFIGGPAGAEGTYNLNGGSFTSVGDAFIGNNGTGTFSASAGSAVFGGDVTLAATETGVGTLNVLGDDSSINVVGDLLVGGDNPTAATLAFDTAGDEDLTLIDVGGIATLTDGSTLTLDVSSDPTPDDVYNLLTASSIIADLGTINFSGPDGYTLQIASGGNGQVLQAVIPEPTSLALLGLGGLGLLRRQRGGRSA